MIPPISIFWGFVGLTAGLATRAYYGGADELMWTVIVVAMSALGFTYRISMSLLFLTLPFILCTIIASGHDGFGFWGWLTIGLVLNAFHIHGHSLAIRFAYSNGATYANYVSRVMAGLQRKDNEN